MKQEEELLMKDLSARLSYMPMVEYKGKNYNVLGITHGRLVLCRPVMSYTLDECPLVEEVKPYLFPLSSMTEEQYEKFIFISGWDVDIEDIRRGKFSCIGYIGLDCMYDAIDWFNAHHFDYRNLIEKSLALDATNLGIY